MLDDERLSDWRPARPIDSLCVEVSKAVAFESKYNKRPTGDHPHARSAESCVVAFLINNHSRSSGGLPGRTGTIHVCRCELNASHTELGPVTGIPFDQSACRSRARLNSVALEPFSLRSVDSAPMQRQGRIVRSSARRASSRREE